MASLKYGAIGTEIKGSIGGTTFQSGKAGFVIKNKPNFKPNLNQTRSGSTRKYNPKQMIAAVSGQWRNLSTEDRLTWSTGAIDYPAMNRFGEPYTPSGYQVFMTLNLQMNVSGIAYLTRCPMPITVHALPGMSLDIISEDELIWSLSEPVAEGFRMAISATKAKSYQTVPMESEYKLITYVVNGDGATIDVADSYQDVFGGWPNNSIIFFKCEMISLTTGQKGVPNYLSAAINW